MAFLPAFSGSQVVRRFFWKSVGCGKRLLQLFLDRTQLFLHRLADRRVDMNDMTYGSPTTTTTSTRARKIFSVPVAELSRVRFFWSHFLSSWSQSCAKTQKFRCKKKKNLSLRPSSAHTRTRTSSMNESRKVGLGTTVEYTERKFKTKA